MKKADFSSIEREGEKEGIAFSVEVVNVILTADCSRNPIRGPASLFEFIHRAPTVPSNQVIVIIIVIVVVADPREPYSYIRELYGCAAKEYRLSAFPADDYRTLESLSVAESLFSKLVHVSPLIKPCLFFPISDNLDIPARKREIIRFLRRFSSSFLYIVLLFTPCFPNMIGHPIDHSLFRVDRQTCARPVLRSVYVTEIRSLRYPPLSQETSIHRSRILNKIDKNRLIIEIPRRLV